VNLLRFSPRLFWIAFLFGGTTLGLMSRGPILAQPATLEVEVEEEQADTSSMETVAVVAVSSYNELLEDIGFLGSLAGRPEIGQMIDGGIAMFTQGKGLAGIDKSRPWGVLLQTDGIQFLPIGCLPVTDLDALLELTQVFGVQVEDLGNGLKEVSMPESEAYFVKAGGKWAYIAQAAETLATLPKDPQALFAPLVTDYDIGARVFVPKVPELYRSIAIEALRGGLEEGLLEKSSDEEEEDYELRQKMASVQLEQLVKMIEEIDELTIGWSLDSEQQRTFADFTYTFLPNSDMAKQLAAYEESKTNFAGFYQPQAAATALFASKADPEIIREEIDQFHTLMQTLRQQVMKGIEGEENFPDDEARKTAQSAVNDFIDAFESTIEGGEMDGGAALNLGSNSVTFIAGLLVKETEKIESGLKKIASIADREPNFPGVTWNAYSHAGVNFHTLSFPIPEMKEAITEAVVEAVVEEVEEEAEFSEPGRPRPRITEDEEATENEKGEKIARQLFGDQIDIAIGIGEKAVYLAVGRDSREAIEQAIDASLAEPNKPAPLFELSFSLGQIMEMAVTLADEENRDMVERIAQMLSNDAQGRDHIRLLGKLIPNGLTYRIEAEEGVLRAIGIAAQVAQENGGFN